MSAAIDKIFDLWFASTELNMTREQARTFFDANLSNASATLQQRVASSNPNSVRAVNVRSM